MGFVLYKRVKETTMHRVCILIVYFYILTMYINIIIINLFIKLLDSNVYVLVTIQGIF